MSDKPLDLKYPLYMAEPASRRFKSMESNQTIEAIFNFLSRIDRVESMISATQAKRPAMEAVIIELEKLFPFNEEFNLEYDYRNRQIIGSMIRYIMGHYGYSPGKSKKMKKGSYIKSAIVYYQFRFFSTDL